MTNRRSINLRVRALGMTLVALIAALTVIAATGAKEGVAAQLQQATYKSPQEAVEALLAAVKSGSTDAIVAVLGRKGREVASSGDAVADAAARGRFESAFAESHDLKQEGDSRAVLLIGKDEFPFPIPIVADAGAWRFDTEAGAVEILDRRIGENELAAIEVLRAYVDAQREYAEVDRDGRGVQYAHKLLSSEGKKDGLYWAAQEGDEVASPAGPEITDTSKPHAGYHFKILSAQGAAAPAGKYSYVINGRLIGGFAMVAWPDEYGKSGVMTFVVNHYGDVYQRDLGQKSAALASSITEYNPDKSWTKVSE